MVVHFFQIITLSCLGILISGCKKDSNLTQSGYKLIARKDKFHVLVSEKYPQDQSMMLLFDKSNVVLSLDDTGEGTKRAVVSAGSLLTSSISLTKEGNPREMTAMLSLPDKKFQVLRDINLDGFWDIRMFPKDKEQYIFLDSQWAKVDAITGKWPEMEAHLEGEIFIFDFNASGWKAK